MCSWRAVGSCCSKVLLLAPPRSMLANLLARKAGPRSSLQVALDGPRGPGGQQAGAVQGRSSQAGGWPQPRCSEHREMPARHYASIVNWVGNGTVKM